MGAPATQEQHGSRRPFGVTIIGFWMVAASVLLFAFAVFRSLSPAYPITSIDLLLTLTVAIMPVGGVFVFLFSWLSMFLATVGLLTGILTLYGYRLARWLNIALSTFVLYQSLMLLLGFLQAYQTYGSVWDVAENLMVISILLSFSAARIYYMFSRGPRTFLRRGLAFLL